jgi:hypothetical protein
MKTFLTSVLALSLLAGAASARPLFHFHHHHHHHGYHHHR